MAEGTGTGDGREVAIALRGIVNRFGSNTVHDGLDLDVPRGEILGIVGGSGTGKSVLLRTIVGLHRPNAGSVRVFGEDVLGARDEDYRRLARRWGVLFQDGALFSSLTVAENIALVLKEHTRLAAPQRRALAALKVALAGLPAAAGDKKPSELSGGMRKRAGLARALALDPDILFLDEPTAGLDPIGAAAFDRLVLELSRSLGLTVVMITHDLDSLHTICDRVGVLLDKRMVVDTIPALMAMSDSWIRDYFHGPRGRAAAEAVARADSVTTGAAVAGA